MALRLVGLAGQQAGQSRGAAALSRASEPSRRSISDFELRPAPAHDPGAPPDRRADTRFGMCHLHQLSELSSESWMPIFLRGSGMPVSWNVISCTNSGSHYSMS